MEHEDGFAGEVMDAVGRLMRDANDIDASRQERADRAMERLLSDIDVSPDVAFLVWSDLTTWLLGMSRHADVLEGLKTIPSSVTPRVPPRSPESRLAGRT